jgi:tetratricopeptide (TPR) repeat protein
MPLLDDMTKLKTTGEITGPKINWRLWWGLFACVAAIVPVCYANTWANGIVFNDELTLLFTGKDSRLTSFMLQALINPLCQGWVRQSYLLDERNYAAAFGWYHLVNVYFHWVAAAALFCLVFRLAWRWHNDQRSNADPYSIALVAALIFACHPLNAESASYISARYSCLGGCNYLLALNFLLLAVLARSGSARVWGYALGAIFGWMSLASSEVGVTLPAAMLALFFLARPSDCQWKDWALDHPYVTGILIALTVSVPLAVVIGFAPAAFPNHYGMGLLSPAAYYATQAKTLIAYYLRCFVVPLGLAVDPPFSVASSWLDPLSIVGAVVLAGLAYAICRFWKQPLLACGLLLVALGFLPHALIPQAESASDPAFYLGVAGLSVVAAVLIEPYLRGSWQKLAERLVPVVIVLSGLSIFHNLDFRTNSTLATATFKVNPNSAVAYTLAAGNEASSKHYAKALENAEKAIAANPDATMAWLAKGAALSRLGKLQEAESALLKASELADRQHLWAGSMVRYALAENYMQQRKLDEAEKVMRRALSEDPYGPRAHYVLGRLAYERKLYEQAAMYLQQAYKDGVFETLQPLADSALHLKRYDVAWQLAQRAVAMDNSDMRAQLTLANAALLANHLPEAEEAIHAVLKQQPHDATALALSSVLAERKDQPVLAKTRREDATKVDANAFSNIVLPEPEKKQP